MLSIYASRAFVYTIPGIVSSLGTERFGYLPVNVLLWAPVAAVLILGLRYTGTAGCSMPSVTTRSPRGSPASASGAARRLHALRALAAMGGMLLLGFVGNPDLGLATPYLLPSVAAVVIGGTRSSAGSAGTAARSSAPHPDRAHLLAERPRRLGVGQAGALRRADHRLHRDLRPRFRRGLSRAAWALRCSRWGV